MTTYNTGNPIGSTEVKDLYDNAQNFDTLSTTTTLETVPDRLGVPRMSLHGFEQEAKRRFESIKFQPPIPYAPGIEVTTSSLTVDYLGVLYYALPSALPFTTGAWNPAQWSPLQNTNPGHELLVFDDYASASAAAATLPDGLEIEAPNADSRLSRFEVQGNALVFKDFVPDVIRMENYAAMRVYSGKYKFIDIVSQGIAGRFYLDDADNVTADNGGTVIVDASGRRWKRVYSGLASVSWFGAKFDGSNETTIAAACLAATGTLYLSAGKRLVCKNLEMQNGYSIDARGSLALPAGCVDNDRLIYGDQKEKLEIRINELDGNYQSQSGDIGTHLVYLTRCPDAVVEIGYCHDHYADTGSEVPSPDGFRNASTGAIWLYRCVRANVKVGLLENWSREGVYVQESDSAVVSVGHCQGHATRNTEYSGVQVSGKYCKLVRASVDFAGASGVGFDVQNGVAQNIISTRTRQNHGVNFGHPGVPASNSIATNIVVDEAWVLGIGVHASTNGLQISNFSIDGAGDSGLSVSDASANVKAVGGRIQRSGKFNIQSSGNALYVADMDYSTLAPVMVEVSVTSGAFVAGAVVTSGAASGTVTKALRNLNGSLQRLILSDVTGTFVAAQSITGGGATGTVASVSVPYAANASIATLSGSAMPVSGGYYVERPDGTSELSFSSVTIDAVADTQVTKDFTHPSGCRFVGNVQCFAQISSAASTSAYVIQKLNCNADATKAQVVIQSTASQTHGLQLLVKGRWK